MLLLGKAVWGMSSSCFFLLAVSVGRKLGRDLPFTFNQPWLRAVHQLQEEFSEEVTLPLAVMPQDSAGQT